MAKNICFILFVMLFACALEVNSLIDHTLSSNETNMDVEAKKAIAIFQTILKKHRVEQVTAIKQLLTFKYEQQYKMLNLMMDKIFEVILSNKVTIESSGYIPGEALPTNETVKDGLYQLLDSTALYCEFQLKLPDVTDRIMGKRHEWLVLAKWAIGFCNATGLYDLKTTELLNLTAQEMNLIERMPSYVNPYRADHTKGGRARESEKKAKEKRVAKGPRISKQRHTEL